MSLEVVNGYPCFNCTDVEYAKKGVDPARPEDDPKSPKTSAKARASGADSREPAVTFGGALKALSETRGSDSETAGLDASRLHRPGSALDMSV